MNAIYIHRQLNTADFPSINGDPVVSVHVKNEHISAIGEHCEHKRARAALHQQTVSIVNDVSFITVG